MVAAPIRRQSSNRRYQVPLALHPPLPCGVQVRETAPSVTVVVYVTGVVPEDTAWSEYPRELAFVAVT